jgi:hypothetical protein
MQNCQPNGIFKSVLDTVLSDLYNCISLQEDDQMLRRVITQSRLIVVILILQFIPLILFPPSSFSATSQEWWLPAVLTVLCLIAVINLFLNRTSISEWSWHLISFAQGFNLISRVLMLFPNITSKVNGVQIFDWAYLVLTIIAIALSVFMLWYIELPEVKVGLLKQESSSESAS